jgi:hypothetical protein
VAIADDADFVPAPTIHSDRNVRDFATADVSESGLLDPRTRNGASVAD